MAQVGSAADGAASSGKTSSEGHSTLAVGRSGGKAAETWERSFYFLMSLLVMVVVAYGFGRKLDEKLIHAASPRPTILYIHALSFAAWVMFFTVQSALVRTRKVKVHKMLGWFGLALGSAIPVVGIATALVMIRMELRQGLTFVAPFFIIAAQDMISFGVTFGLAFWWRTKPEFHRRLMFVATCALTSAAFTRIPWVPGRWFYAGVDCLILFGVVRDLITMKRIHPVYLWGLPLMMLGQMATMYVMVTKWPPWMKVVNAIFG